MLFYDSYCLTSQIDIDSLAIHDWPAVNICERDALMEMETDEKIVNVDNKYSDPQLCATIACDIYQHLRASEVQPFFYIILFALYEFYFRMFELWLKKIGFSLHNQRRKPTLLVQLKSSWYRVQFRETEWPRALLLFFTAHSSRTNSSQAQR